MLTIARAAEGASQLAARPFGRQRTAAVEAYAHRVYNLRMATESKTQRWNMRVTEDVDAIVRLAAEQNDQPLTDFVVQAARVVAEDALADRRVFRLDEAAWDEFVEMLDRQAQPVPELARLLSSASVFDD